MAFYLTKLRKEDLKELGILLSYGGLLSPPRFMPRGVLIHLTVALSAEIQRRVSLDDCQFIEPMPLALDLAKVEQEELKATSARILDVLPRCKNEEVRRVLSEIRDQIQQALT